MLLSCNKLIAQEIYSKQSLEDIIENIAVGLEDDVDYTSLYEDLNFYINNPLNINAAKLEDLEKLHFLNDFQIKSLLDYIDKNGEFLSIYELQLVFGFSEQDIFNIEPFITVSENSRSESIKIRNALKYGNNQIFIRSQKVLEEQVGYSSISDSALLENPNSRYLGNPYKIYAKYKYTYKNKIYLGFTSEKDPAEEFFSGSNKNGFDFYSAHLQINDVSIIKTLCLGDFQSKFGQGLVLWSDMGIGKSPDVLNIRKRTQGLKKYSSSNENVFMRGIGTTIELKDFEFSLFYSQKNIDANIVDSTENEILNVSSFQNTGLHSIPSEIVDEKVLGEQIIGGNISFNKSNFKLGVTALNYQYSANLNKDFNPKNQFDFQGSQNSILSLDYQFILRGFNFFGEEAISESGGMAFLNGMLINLAPQISISALHRHYDRNYQSYYGNAFSESSGINNESGLYFGLEVNPFKKWSISAYFDNYHFPWLITSVDAPSNGFDWFCQVNYTPTSHLSMYFKIKNETKQVNQNANSGLDKIVDKNNLKARFHINTQVNEYLVLKSRVEASKVSTQNIVSDYGYLIYQDVFYNFKKVPISLNMRFAIFDTDSYNSRIYSYESDILYAFSIPAYYSKGTRTYLNLKYSVSNFMDIWLRYSQTYYSDLDIISSGLTQINGNTKSEIKAQVRFKF